MRTKMEPWEENRLTFPFKHTHSTLDCYFMFLDQLSEIGSFFAAYMKLSHGKLVAEKHSFRLVRL